MEPLCTALTRHLSFPSCSVIGPPVLFWVTVNNSCCHARESRVAEKKGKKKKEERGADFEHGGGLEGRVSLVLGLPVCVRLRVCLARRVLTVSLPSGPSPPPAG